MANLAYSYNWHWLCGTRWTWVVPVKPQQPHYLFERTPEIHSVKVRTGHCDLERKTVHFCLEGIELLSLNRPGNTLESITRCANDTTQRVNAMFRVDM